MATKVIPEQKIFVCDRCTCEARPRVAGGLLQFTGALLSIEGSWGAGRNFTLELCDDCQKAVYDMIQKDKKEMHSVASAQ